jgi:chorismate-pyruvate lyase
MRQCRTLPWTSPALNALVTLVMCVALNTCDTRTNAATRQLQALNTELLAGDSATAVLEHWCASHRLAAEPRIHAERIAGVDQPADGEVRRALGAGPGEPVHYRHVRLRCGAVVLSEADNWYLPARLTPAMNAALEATDEPFGRVVQPLGFRRVHRAAELLWPPESRGRRVSNQPGELPTTVLVHRAVLVLPDGRPFSYVVEHYQREALAGR